MRDEFWSYDRERGWVIRRRPTRPCPACGGPAVRVARRLVDRLHSVIRPVQRYQCRAADCGWVGNFRGEGGEPTASAAGWLPFVAGAFAATGIGLALLIFVL